ncbi:MAG: nucleotidyltransferase family protein [Candidatus Contendobacter sp.]|nr:nucleotidyltransferase family protein [Candidatus Contendobacter sp.]
MTPRTPHVWLCHCLAPDAWCPTTELLHSMEQPGFDWEPILALAHRGLVATSLYPALQRRGLLAAAPTEVVAHLTTLHALNAEHNQLLRRELRAAARLFNQIGVEPLLLKGALALLPDAYPGAESRLMGDLDLLVPADRLADCQQALNAFGYHAAHPETGHAGHHHAPPLFHPEHGCKFELHRAVLGRLLEAVLPTKDIWRDSHRVVLEGAFVRAPSPTHRILHNALHTLLQDHRAESGILELRQLLDLVQLRARDDAGIDWPLVQARFEARGQYAALGAYLRAARDLFGQPLPAGCPPSIAATWLEWKFTFGVRHPAAIRWYHWHTRLKRLPKRLCTPSWYPMKIRALLRGAPL